MKKIVLVSLVCLLFAQMSIAQEKRTYRFGLQGSPAIAWMKTKGKDIEGNGVNLKLSYGFMMEYSVADNFAIVTGFNVGYNGGKIRTFNESGISNNIPYTNMIVTKEYKLQNIEIPLSIKMKTKEIGYMTYFINVGVAPSVNIAAKGSYSFVDAANNENKLLNKDNEDIKSDIALFRAGFLVGGGVEYSLGGSTSAVASVSFNNGLTDALKGNSTAITNYVSLNLGILF